MYCVKCGTEIHDDWEYCRKCGVKLREEYSYDNRSEITQKQYSNRSEITNNRYVVNISHCDINISQCDLFRDNTEKRGN